MSKTGTAVKKTEKPVAKKPGVLAVEQVVTENAAFEPVAKSAEKPVAAPISTSATKPEAKATDKPKKEGVKPKGEARSEPKEKVKKAKLVRDSFTMPESEYKALQEVKRDFLKAGVEVKKSELLRIGVALIRQADQAKLREVLASLPSLKAGRPKKERTTEK